LADRVQYLESAVGDSADKHAQELAATHAKLDRLQGHLADTREKHRSALDDIHKLHRCGQEQFEVHHASLQERLDYMEKLIGDSADKHQQIVKEIEGHKAIHYKLTGESQAHASHRVTIEERLEALETVASESAQVHGDELAAAHSKIEKLHGNMMDDRKAREAHQSSMRDQISKEAKARDAHHATVQERLEYLEQLLGDSADKHEKHVKEIETLRCLHSKQASDAKAREAHHASMTQRLEYLEGVLNDSADKHEQHLRKLEDAHDKINVLHGRFTEERAKRDAHTTALDDFKKHHASHSQTVT